MPQRTYPRPDSHHAVTAQNVLARHEVATGRPTTLPVPIDLIIESTYKIRVLWDEIVEPPGTKILGALFPAAKRIVMNTRHEELFGKVIGPERFTLAHELGHWIYDADDPAQQTFDLVPAVDGFCYYRERDDLSDDLRIREINANKFASHILLPEHLVRAADLDQVAANFGATAALWGVSQQTLRIRLEGLGLLDNLDRMKLELPDVGDLR